MNKGGNVLEDKGPFLVVQLDYQLHAGLTESISWFCWVMTLSSFKWNGNSLHLLLGWDFFCADGKGDFVFYSNFYWIFLCFCPPDLQPPTPQPPKDITLLMAGPLKRKGDKFPYGILNQSIIATITETFSYL